MTSPIGRNPKNNLARRSGRGFTLIELILVMALLSIVFAVASPSLAKFFKGRSLLEESRRFLEVTRYAQNQAVSLSIPLEVWHKPEERTYGISPAPGYVLDAKEEFVLPYEEEFHFNFIQDNTVNENGAVIVFLPDGTLDESSLYAVSIQQDNDKSIYYLIKNDYGTGYEIVNQEEYDNAINRKDLFAKLR